MPRFPFRFPFLLPLVLFSACQAGKVSQAPSWQVMEQVDSLLDVTQDARRAEASEPELQDRANEAFGDFIFNFSSSPSLQRRRIRFPLDEVWGDSVRKVGQGEWTYRPLLSQMGCYTLLFDHERDLELDQAPGDQAAGSARLEFISLDDLSLEAYSFRKDSLFWMLESVRLRSLQKGDQDSFFDFYRSFSRDSAYQMAHVSPQLGFVTIDPDDEFSLLETTMDRAQWTAFRPDLPDSVLTNIDYGQANEDLSRHKILKVIGVGNGLMNVLHFRFRQGFWELYRFEDLSI